MTDNDFGYDSDFGSDDNSGLAAAIIGGGIAAGSQTINSIIAAKYNRENADVQRKWSEQMLSLQNAWNEKMWNASNEYNSPSAQVQRLRDAGLNPLYYGIDGVAAQPMQSAQPLGYERASMPVLPNPVAVGFDAASKVASIGNVQADTAKKMNENLSETVKREKMTEEINEIKQNIRNLEANEGLTVEQRKNLEKATSWLDRLNTAVVAEKESRSRLDESQRKRVEELLLGEKIIQSKTIEDFERKWSKIEAEIDKMSQETGLLKEDIENYALNHANNGFMGTGISLPNLIRVLIAGSNSDKVSLPDELASESHARP